MADEERFLALWASCKSPIILNSPCSLRIITASCRTQVLISKHFIPPFKKHMLCICFLNGGRREIRTLDKAFDPIHTFQACAFNHSAIRPMKIQFKKL